MATEETTLQTSDGRIIELNPQGYLLYPSDWNEEIAHIIAKKRIY